MNLTADEMTTLVLRLLTLAAIYGAIALAVAIGLGELKALAEATGRGASAPRPRLVQLDAAGRGRGWPLEPVTTIGRAATNSVAIDDPFLSHEHAEIVREAGRWWVRDKGSTNGTLLNGSPVAGRTAIQPGDVVQFGGIRLQLVFGSGSGGDG